VISGVLNVVGRGSQEVAQIGGCVIIIMGLVDLVLFIVFWVKIANYSNRLATEDWGQPDMRRAFDRYDDGGRDYPKSSPPPSSEDTYRPDDDDRYRQ
jgi:hypothetical protein